ncbi:hypothetical protein PT015_22950 [Candidatus Mycobacterium wuenschmannii]|uniref:Secreted protein n=1 Tax=Candidatus Mycobacterium wuenschmannii TaxID=3027808 RepID=A0ABY8VY69_9MYCO|nr:hypothetical protein [Candidatus Mycobacterium wuenschmannii]WIM87657.1 hypothetical protein PT015_22950 [Candidatus Mycobacterium wuenschmannii]
MKLHRMILASAVLIGGITAVTTGTASASGPPGCTSYACWCPGQPIPGNIAGDWDMNSCHDWHYSFHDDKNAPHQQIVQGPMMCSYGPGFLPPCAA